MDNNQLQTFNDASAATENLFDEGEQLSIEGIENLEQDTEETPVEETPATENTDPTTENVDPVTENAVQTAEIAAQTANEKDQQLQQVLGELNALREQNETLQQTISQMSDQQKENLIEEVMPVLDISNLAFDDEETIQAKQIEFANKMAEYVKGNMMKELEPFVAQAKEGMYEKEKSEVLTALATIPELEGIEGMLPQLDKIITNNKALSSPDVPIEEKYITAYAIAKGVNSMNTPEKELSAEELMELYESNTDFQELLEKKRLEQVQEGQQVPPFSASSGAVNAALNIKEKPKTFEEASKRTREMFGAN